MSRLSPDLEQILNARLRYYRDLGVYDFYRRSEPDAHASSPAEQVDAGNAAAPAVIDAPALDLQATPSSPYPTLDPEPAIPPRKPVSLPPALVPDVVPAAQRPAALAAIRAEIGDCTRCPLAFQGRHKIVFADGDPNARLMFVGEGPGADEDAQGLPFVGRAGQLLNNMISAMGLKREQVYIANVVKCRPPQNRTPEPEEANTCMQFLWQQIDVVRPEVLVALGATAATYLLGRKASLASLRGTIHQLRSSKLIVTYHPAYLLRDPTQKKEAWKDLQIAMAELGLKAAKSTES
jgi:uracil-DNA glycosylase family 4